MVVPKKVPTSSLKAVNEGSKESDSACTESYAIRSVMRVNHGGSKQGGDEMFFTSGLKVTNVKSGESLSSQYCSVKIQL